MRTMMRVLLILALTAGNTYALMPHCMKACPVERQLCFPTCHLPERTDYVCIQRCAAQKADQADCVAGCRALRLRADKGETDEGDVPALDYSGILASDLSVAKEGVSLIGESAKEFNRRLGLIRSQAEALLARLQPLLVAGSRNQKEIADDIVDTLLQFEDTKYVAPREAIRDFLQNNLTTRNPQHFASDRLEFLKRKVYEATGIERLMYNTLLPALDVLNQGGPSLTQEQVDAVRGDITHFINGIEGFTFGNYNIWVMKQELLYFFDYMSRNE